MHWIHCVVVLQAVVTLAIEHSKQSPIYPEFIVNPLPAENVDNLFYITGLSVSDNRYYTWWKWFMPTFYEDHLNGANYTVLEPHHPSDVLCHIRMIGYATPTYIHYHPGGNGQVESLGNWTQLAGFKCYYTVYMVKYENLRFAIYCPVWTEYAQRSIYNDGATVTPQSICDSFRSDPRVSVRLFPPEQPVYWEKLRNNRPLPVSPPSKSLPSTFQVSVKSNADIQAFSITLREEETRRFQPLGVFTKTRDPKKRIVTTIQVFHNRITGPLMSLFIEHYCRLGFRVVIFDMFGWHYSFVRDLLAGRTDLDVIYHPYTMLQLIRPDYFSYDYANLQSLEYKAFYSRDVKENRKDAIPVLENTDLLDTDKQLTFDSALLQYAHSTAILVADIDELLYANDLRNLRRYLDSTLSESRQEWENILFGRVAVGGIVPSGEVVYTEGSDKDMIQSTENCINKAYESQRNYQAMLNCFRGPLIPQRFAKFADTMGVCPFSWNHFSCMDYNRKKGNLYWSVDKVYELHMSVRRPWIKLLHLSHIGYMRSIFYLNYKVIQGNGTVSFKQEPTNPLAAAYEPSFRHW